jgi:hypothetical protein
VKQQLAIGNWQLAIGNRQLATSHWQPQLPVQSCQFAVNTNDCEGTSVALSDPKGRAEQPGWEGDDCPDQLQSAVNSNPDQSEGQQQNPHKWIEHQRQKR